ncbi:muscle segmentation homeobox [Anopheles cruzii]|uniref:muscle segmentation homeobox n=1 Tax=Anopheles cruzii TaxID=68878 RepID=UPI0022EC2E6F|nr:muscle segmentation homeobox [Anopheles cruzii]
MCRNYKVFSPPQQQQEQQPQKDEGGTSDSTAEMAHGLGVVVGMMRCGSSDTVKGEPGVARSATGSPPGGHNSSSAKMGSRRIFTPQFKLQVLDSYRNDGDCKGNQRATARKYGIHRRQIQKWLQVESNLRSVVANGGSTVGGSTANNGSGSSSSVSSPSGASSGGASMKMSLLSHHHQHHNPHHPLHPLPLQHHLHYPHHHHHHLQAHHHQGLTAAGLPAGYHHHAHHHHMQQQHPLAFHPTVVSQGALPPPGLVDTARHRVARGNGACMVSPPAVLTHTTTAAAAAIPVSSCSPLSVTSSIGGASSSSSAASALSALSPSSASLPARSPPSSASLRRPSPATAVPSGGELSHQQPQSSPSSASSPPVIFSPVPLLAAAAAVPNEPSSSVAATYYTQYYRHFHAAAAAAAAAQRPHSSASDHEEISVNDEADPPTTVAPEPEVGVEEAWDLSCHRADRKRSSSEVGGALLAPETSRPPKSIKLFKPYLLDGDEKEVEGKEERGEEDHTAQQHRQRRDSALAVDDDKDSTRESPAISESLTVGKTATTAHPFPIIWSNSSPGFHEHGFYETASGPRTTGPFPVGGAAATLTATQTTIGGARPTWSSPQASPVSGYDSSTSISSVYSGPEEESTTNGQQQQQQPKQPPVRPEVKQQQQQAIESEADCRADYRAVASKYNISRKYVEKWLQQEPEDDHHHQHRSAPSAATGLAGAVSRGPSLVVG